jgi:hypothetical protein
VPGSQEGEGRLGLAAPGSAILRRSLQYARRSLEGGRDDDERLLEGIEELLYSDRGSLPAVDGEAVQFQNGKYSALHDGLLEKSGVCIRRNGKARTPGVIRSASTEANLADPKIRRVLGRPGVTSSWRSDSRK